MARVGMLTRGYRRVKSAVTKPKRYLGIGARKRYPTSARGVTAAAAKKAIFRKRRIGAAGGVIGVGALGGAYAYKKKRSRRRK